MELIFNFKPDRLKEFNEIFEDNINYNNETKQANYYLSTNIHFNNNFINVIKYIDNKIIKTTTFRYITNLTIDNYNIKEIVTLGRNRWKIENEGFYTQKHRTFY